MYIRCRYASSSAGHMFNSICQWFIRCMCSAYQASSICILHPAAAVLLCYTTSATLKLLTDTQSSVMAPDRPTLPGHTA